MEDRKEEIDRIVDTLRDIWQENPEMRLGQLLMDGFVTVKIDDDQTFYNTSDKVLVEGLYQMEVKRMLAKKPKWTHTWRAW